MFISWLMPHASVMGPFTSGAPTLERHSSMYSSTQQDTHHFFSASVANIFQKGSSGQCRPTLGNSCFGFFNWLKKLSHKNLKLSRSESFSYVGSHVLGFGGAENDYCQLRNALELLRPHCPESSTAEIHQRYLKVTLNSAMLFVAIHCNEILPCFDKYRPIVLNFDLTLIRDAVREMSDPNPLFDVYLPSYFWHAKMILRC